MAESARGLRTALLLVAGALLGLALLLYTRGEYGPLGPEAVPYDQVPCARCRMLVSEPRFAAQLRLEEGGVRFFDDPGCLLLWRHEHPEDRGRAFFHHHREEAWIGEEEVAFVAVLEPTPMGYGLGAVRRGESEEALLPAEAFARLLATHRPTGAAP